MFFIYEGHNNIVPRGRLHPDLTSAVRNCSLVKELDDSAQGTGFAFIVMADVFTKIPGAPFWSALFFLMLLSLGLGSQIGIIEGLTSTLFDHPRLHKVRVVIGGDRSLHLALAAGEEACADGGRGAVLLPAGSGVHHRGRGVLAHSLRHIRGHRQ